jgi:hypothetical protein
MSDEHPFHADLSALGFRVVQEDRRGVVQYSWKATRFLTYWVHWNPVDGDVLFTFELDIGDLMHERGMQIGANESLNTFLYPQFDAKGTADIGFVVREIDRIEAVLKSIDLTADA